MMQIRLIGRNAAAFIVGLSVFAGAANGRAEASETVAVRAGKLYTLNPATTTAPAGSAAASVGLIENGVVVIRDGTISAVGPAATTPIPEGCTVHEAPVATPGIIDAHSTLGLSGLFNTAHDSDQLESSAPIQPELRALDAFNPNDKLVEFIRSFGITTVHTGHAPGEAVSGQTIIVKTVGGTVEDGLLSPLGAVACTLGPSAEKPGGKSPGTRAKIIALLRTELIKAREHDRKVAEAPAAPKEGSGDDAPKPPDRNLRLETLAAVLREEVPLLITAQRAQDIEAALRLQAEYGFRLMLDGAAESYLLIDRLKACEPPPVIIVHPTMARAYGELENSSFTTAAKLREAGLTVLLQSGYEAYVPKARVVLFEAAIAAANGLGFENALAAITIEPAKALGIDARVGSLAVGKDADVALYDGDPFEYTTHCVRVLIDGRVVSEMAR